MIPSTPAAGKAQPDFAALPEVLTKRLAGENIFSASDWLKLSKKRRRSIWGITCKHVELIDQIANHSRQEQPG